MRAESPDPRSLAYRIEHQIESQAELHVVVELADDGFVLTGLVDSEEARQAALDIARSMAGGRRVDDNLEVAVRPVGVMDTYTDAPPVAELPDGRELEIEPDFVSEQQEPVERELTDIAISSDDLGFDEEFAQFPPTDPVVRPDDEMNAEVLGGFSPTSRSAMGVAPSALDNQPGDEALADAIRRELREDAATSEFVIHVEVREGVAYLRGRVPHFEDISNIEAVAGDVPGVREVVDQLDVAS